MTSLLDLAPTGIPPVLRGAAEVHRVLDDLGTTGVAASPAALGEALQEWTRVESRISALRHEILRAADRANAAAASGASDTGAWAAQLTLTDNAALAREMKLARDLAQTSSPTRAALAEGRISAEHANVITTARKQLPQGVTPEQAQTVEEVLVEKAASMKPKQLRQEARRALAAIEPDETVVDAHEHDLVRSEEERAYAATKLTLHDNGDGTITGHFTVPTFQGQLLGKILDTISAPRRSRLGATFAQAGPDTERPGRYEDPAHRRGLAFLEVLEHLPTDRLHGKTAATVVITLDHQTLQDGLKVAGLDTGEVITASQARRIACNAGLIPAVLGGQSQPLDLGRAKRLFSETQRIALGLRHATCAADGCERPYAWCELHHAAQWARGGRTDLNDAIPLCHFHHRRIHDAHYQHQARADGSITFHLRT